MEAITINNTILEHIGPPLTAFFHDASSNDWVRKSNFSPNDGVPHFPDMNACFKWMAERRQAEPGYQAGFVMDFAGRNVYFDSNAAASRALEVIAEQKLGPHFLHFMRRQF